MLSRLSPIGPRHHGVQKNVGARERSFEIDLLSDVVAYAIDARREDHCRGSDGREVIGVVAGLALNARASGDLALTPIAPEPRSIRRKARLAERPWIFDLSRNPRTRCLFFDRFHDFHPHSLCAARVRMAEVNI